MNYAIKVGTGSLLQFLASIRKVVMLIKEYKITSIAPMLDFSAGQPSPSQTPTSTASDGAHRAPLEINNTPIADRSMLSEK